MRKFIVCGLFLLVTGNIVAQPLNVLFPKQEATNVNPDTYFSIQFSDSVQLHNKGFIRIYDAATDEMVDELDMAISPGPRNTRTPYPYNTFSYAGIPDSLYTVAKPDRDTTHHYHTNYIGGKDAIDVYHFYPVLMKANVAKIYPHHHRLQYNRRYYITIDAAVFSVEGNNVFNGIQKGAWSFTTKKQPALITTVSVAADGAGDFTTLQAAIDFILFDNKKPYSIIIKNGEYNEIIHCKNRDNISFKGESREGVVVQYPNNGVFNLKEFSADPALSKNVHNIRAVMAVHGSNNISIQHLTLLSVGDAPAQAEALLVIGDKIIVNNVGIYGSGDALQATGRIYVQNSTISGYGDNVLGYGAVFFKNCEFISFAGPHLWVRNTDKNHGNVLFNCILRTTGNVQTHIARAPDNKGTKYPFAEAVLINCKTDGLKPERWGKVTDSAQHVRYWEYNTTDLLTGKPASMPGPHPAAKQLDKDKDASFIKLYSDPAFVLNGWKPVIK